MAWGTLALVAVDFVMAGAAMKTQIVEKRIWLSSNYLAYTQQAICD